MRYQYSPSAGEQVRLEAVTTCVGFDDMLDVTLGFNHPHLDTMIIVTSHDDRQTQRVAQKHGAICVTTDLFQKNGRAFNKGAAINAGFGYFQWSGWRMHLDADIALPDNFRRMLFNHTYLDRGTLYGADRVNVIGAAEIAALKTQPAQYSERIFVESPIARGVMGRFVHPLHGYLPIGYFQLWNALRQMDYPYSLGHAAHDDGLFAMLWPESKRALLPSVIVYHLSMAPPVVMQNWNGRTSARLDQT